MRLAGDAGSNAAIVKSRKSFRRIRTKCTRRVGWVTLFRANPTYTGLYFIIASLCFSAAASAQDFYVSPSGNDQANGLFFESGQPGNNGPFQTLARAQLAIRDLKKTGQFKEPVTVHIAPGAYWLRKPLEFDIRDSGFAGREISWQAEKGAVVISGGVPLQNCEQSSGKLWSCPVSGLGLGGNKYSNESRKKGDFPGFNLYIGRQRLHLARWPDSDWAHIKVPLDEKTSFSSFEQLPPVKNDSAQAQVHTFAGNDWHDEYLPVDSIDASQNRIKLSAGAAYPLASGRRFYLQNIRSELNAPGEWFHDRPNSTILFIPPERAAPENIVVSALPNLISLKGANHIGFRNMAFRHSTGIAVSINHASNVELDGVEIDSVDGSAIEAVNSSNITVANSHIHDTGEAGILIGGGNRNTLQASNNLVHNNHIHHLGAIVMTYMPAVGTSGVGSRITHNLIEHAPGAGVLVSGNEHLLEKNEIRHVCEQASDCGAIYTGRNWTYRGNIIRYNSIHDIYGYGLESVDAARNRVTYVAHGAVGVYLDDAVSSYTVTGNIFDKAGAMSIQLGGGRDNRIENNLFNTGYYAIWVDNRSPAYNWAVNRATLAEVPYRSAVWQAKYPELALPMQNDTWPEGNTIQGNIIVSTKANGLALRYLLPAQGNDIANNLVWSVNGQIGVDYDILDRQKTKGGAPWQEWLAEGVEKGSINADPCATITGNQVKFCSDSPIRQIGFKPLPSDIGLIK